MKQYIHKVRERFGNNGNNKDHGAALSDATEPNVMLRFGSRFIHKALMFVIGQKLLIIAINS